VGWRGTGGARTAATAISSVVAVLATALLVGAPAASADPDLTKARAAAAQLRDKVDLLRAEAEAAAEDYGDANSQLDQVVAKLINADEDLDSATLDARTADGRTADAARQMYMTGGPGALYASVLSGQDIGDVLDRLASVDSVVRGSIIAGSDARERVAVAKASTQDLALLTAQRRVLEDRKVAAATKAAMYLAQADAALAAATDTVRRLVEAERARAQARAEAAARAAALDAPWTTNAVPEDEYAAVDTAIAEATADPATPYAVAALSDARKWLGTPYSAGGGGRNGPGLGWCSSLAPDDGRTDSGDCAAERTIGFDCSSFVLRVYSQAGLNLPRVSRQQYRAGTPVALKDIRPGDLLFWAYSTSNPNSIHHVAMYLGHGLMVHAPHTGDHVRVASVYLRGFIGAVRPT
jgi:cell wall-associated NlpC family hydrolase